jgi:hypothetical protein
MTSAAKRIIELLCGHVTRDGRGLIRVDYFKEGSPDDLEARRTLARMFRSTVPLDLGLRGIVADLFDPDRDEVDRIIRFERRRRGKPSIPAIAEKEIAEFIWSQRQAGEKIATAVSRATKQFGLKRSRVQAIWSQWQPILRRLKRSDLVRRIRD